MLTDDYVWASYDKSCQREFSAGSYRGFRLWICVNADATQMGCETLSACAVSDREQLSTGFHGDVANAMESIKAECDHWHADGQG